MDTTQATRPEANDIVDKLMSDKLALDRVMRRALSPAAMTDDERTRMQDEANRSSDRKQAQDLAAFTALEKGVEKDGILMAVVSATQDAEKTGIRSVADGMTRAYENGFIRKDSPLLAASQRLEKTGETDLEDSAKTPSAENAKSRRASMFLGKIDRDEDLAADPAKRARKLAGVAQIAQTDGDRETADAAAVAAISQAQLFVDAQARQRAKVTQKSSDHAR